MKIYIESNHLSSGHGAAHIFDSLSSATTRDPNRMKGVVRKDGTLKLADESFEKKLKALAQHGKVGFSTLSVNGKKFPGYLYLDIDKPEYIVQNDVQTVQTESVHESVQENDVQTENVQKVIVEYTDVVPNEIDIEVNRPIKVWEKIDALDFKLELIPVYYDARAIRKQDKSKIVGEFDAINSTITFSDETVVKRIKEAVRCAVNCPIGISRMILREGLYMDFIGPTYTITQILPIEQDDDEEETFTAHFLNDEDAEQSEEEVSVKSISPELTESELRSMLGSISGKDFFELNKGIKKLPAAQTAVGNTSLGNSSNVEKITESTMNKYVSWAQSLSF